MIADVRRLLKAKPFVPFVIVTSGGNRYEVPTADHCDVGPAGNRLHIWFDDDTSIIVAGLHITSVELASEAPAS